MSRLKVENGVTVFGELKNFKNINEPMISTRRGRGLSNADGRGNNRRNRGRGDNRNKNRNNRSSEKIFSFYE